MRRDVTGLRCPLVDGPLSGCNSEKVFVVRRSSRIEGGTLRATRCASYRRVLIRRCGSNCRFGVVA